MRYTLDPEQRNPSTKLEHSKISAPRTSKFPTREYMYRLYGNEVKRNTDHDEIFELLIMMISFILII